MTDWSVAQLKKNGALPLYEQLYLLLRDEIVSGRLPAGSKMPTEEELCKKFEISRPVARQAYNKLLESGYVERMRGRGSFVRTVDLCSRFINKQLSFADEMMLCGNTFRTKLLRQEWVDYTPEVFAKLRLEQNDRCFHIVRMRYVDEKPYVLIENFVPESLCPGINAYDFEQNSLYEILQSVYNERIMGARRTLRAQTATSEFAAEFGVRRGSPVLLMENVAFDQRERPIDFSKEYLDGLVQKFEFDVVNN